MEPGLGQRYSGQQRRTAAQHKEPGGNDNMGASQVLQSRCMLVRWNTGVNRGFRSYGEGATRVIRVLSRFALQPRGSGSL